MARLLSELLERKTRLVVLTGAGVSAEAGIPTYRDDDGVWRSGRPIQHQEFISSAASRRRYWARSMVGWRRVAASKPARGHHALARLEASGHVRLLATQNVDRLHQRAGHQEVVDLHGRIDRVGCLDCRECITRVEMQDALEALNPPHADASAPLIRPDGDADIDERRLDGFKVPSCGACGGVLMPDVVFFGGTVPRPRVTRIVNAIHACDALLAVGTSLMVYSGYRFCRLAHELGKPLIIVNRGRTRADELASEMVRADCGEVLERLAAEAPASSRA